MVAAESSAISRSSTEVRVAVPSHATLTSLLLAELGVWPAAAALCSAFGAGLQESGDCWPSTL